MFHVKHDSKPLGDVSRETLERLEIYVALLLRWNRTINLISRGDEALIWDRHVADSLALARHLPPEFSHAIDIGSGGGFPGMVLAIATLRPFHLVESDQRKSAFLREVARELSLPISVHATRIETAKLPVAPVITARAVAPLAILLAWATPHLAPHGICLFPKGRTADDELTAARLEWHMDVVSTPSPTDPSAKILRISEVARVGSQP
jgi:16S rRNA (guanine527-N7)-methyltransferase